MDFKAYLEKVYSGAKTALTLANRCIESANIRKKQYTAMPIALNMDDASMIAKEGNKVTIAADGVYPDRTTIEWFNNSERKLTYIGKDVVLIVKFEEKKTAVEERYTDNGISYKNHYIIENNVAAVAG